MLTSKYPKYPNFKNKPFAYSLLKVYVVIALPTNNFFSKVVYVFNLKQWFSLPVSLYGSKLGIKITEIYFL